MSNVNRHSQPFIMVLSVTVILLVVSQFNTQFFILGKKTKKVEPLADIMQKGILKKVPMTHPVITDSIIAKDISAFALRQTDSSNIFDFENDSTSALSHFFQSLNALKKKKHKTRIAYFGDSMIEGDLISQDLRECMQDFFGGNGVGYLPVTSIVSGFRTSVIHSFEGWTTHNLLENIPASHSLGIAGYSFVPAIINVTDTTNLTAGSWVKYTAVNKQHLNRFYETKLLYGKSDGDNYVVINGSRYKLKGDSAVNQLTVNSSAQQVNARFQCKSSIDIFGFSMESDSGVFVDNFSFRGNSGLPIQKVKQNIYAATNDCLDYDLIILEYGLNAVNPSVTDFSWYERGMNVVIKHMQASFPNTSILLISVGDKSYRKDGVYQTDPSVPILVEAQKRMAKDNKLAFWSLYDAMGGNGSMVKWVEGDTVLANRDYTHFNFKGAHKVGKLLFSKLLGEYNDYNKQQNLKLVN
ncbi:MAG: hypothetical protein H0X46_02975 [Bacteroidetes bacterium]|nr:hypothetical protein [Bacteroidota bacterium]